MTVWDYALYCKHTTKQFIEAKEIAGRGERIAPLLTGIRSRFRPNPLMHADSWLGIGTGNILWSNYEARYYYFPVQFRPGLDRADPKDFEELTPNRTRVPGKHPPGCGSSPVQVHAIDRPGRGLEERPVARCDHRSVVRPGSRAWRSSSLRAAKSLAIKHSSRGALIDRPAEPGPRELRVLRGDFIPESDVLRIKN